MVFEKESVRKKDRAVMQPKGAAPIRLSRMCPGPAAEPQLAWWVVIVGDAGGAAMAFDETAWKERLAKPRQKGA